MTVDLTIFFGTRRVGLTFLGVRRPAAWVYLMRTFHTSPYFKAGFDLRSNRPQPYKPRLWMNRGL